MTFLCFKDGSLYRSGERSEVERNVNINTEWIETLLMKRMRDDVCQTAASKLHKTLVLVE